MNNWNLRITWESTVIAKWIQLTDLGSDNVYNGKEHPGNPMDWAKSVGIRFTFWAGFGEHNYPRYNPGSNVERVNRDAWKGFLVLARLKDKYGRPVFPPSQAHSQVRPEATLLCVLAYLVYCYKMYCMRVIQASGTLCSWLNFSWLNMYSCPDHVRLAFMTLLQASHEHQTISCIRNPFSHSLAELT